MTGDHHGRGAGQATLLVRAADPILGTHRQVWTELADVTSPARYRRVLAWLAGAMEQVFLGDLFPGIIGFGRVHCVRYSLAVTGWHGFP
jgi:hypothetical protein